MKKICMLLFALLVWGCGDESVDSSESPYASLAFMVGTASGAVDSDLTLFGVPKCIDTGNPDRPVVWEISGLATSLREQVTIMTPFAQTSAGDYTLIGTADDSRPGEPRYEISYQAEEQSIPRFDSGSGTLALSDFSFEVGEPIRGSFSAQLMNENEQTVMIDGLFDGEASSITFEDCE